MRRKLTRERLVELREQGLTFASRIVGLSDGGMGSREVADEVGCPRHYVYQVLRQVEHKRYAEGRRRCVKCSFLEEEQNPLGENGVCLWCRLQGMRVNLLEWHESGAAMEYACSGLLAGLIVLVNWLVAWRGRGGSAWPRVTNLTKVIERMETDGREGCRRM